MKTKTISKKIFDSKKLPSYLIVSICFGCSAIISIIALKSQGATDFAMTLFGVLALGGELVKFHFPSTAIASKDMHMGLRICFMFIGIIAVFYSVAFTFAFSKNEAASLKNEFVANSQEVKDAKIAKETKASLVTRLEGELESLKSDKITDLKKIDPVKYRTVRGLARDKFDLKISKKSKELTKQQTTKSTISPNKKNTPTTSTVATKTINVGVTNLFATVQAENNFFSCFAIFMEISGIFALVDLKKRSVNVLKQYTTYEVVDADSAQDNNVTYLSKAKENVDDYIIDKPDGPIIYKKNKVPPTPEKINKVSMSKDFNQIDVISYLDCIYDIKNSTKLPMSCGEGKIRKVTGFSDKIVRGIRYYLEQLDILVIVQKGNFKNTKILVPYSTALKKVKD